MRGQLEVLEISQVRLDLRNNLCLVDMALEKALERALHFEAVTRIEEAENELRIAAIQSNENCLLVKLIID